MNHYLKIRRGDIFYADLTPVRGSEQDGIRPILIIQNNVGNQFSPTVIGIPITSQLKKTRLPTHVPIQSNITGLPKESIILVEQIRTLDKIRLKNKIGRMDSDTMEKVKHALKISFSIRFPWNQLFEDW